jgi:hypothetical protein
VTNNQGHSQPDRPPDVETPNFQLWIDQMEKLPGSPSALVLNVAAGEELYENRAYRATIHTGYECHFITKKNEELYWTVVMLFGPDGKPVFSTGTAGPMLLKTYEDMVKAFEEACADQFDIEEPLVVPGRHIMLYLKGKNP